MLSLILAASLLVAPQARPVRTPIAPAPAVSPVTGSSPSLPAPNINAAQSQLGDSSGPHFAPRPMTLLGDMIDAAADANKQQQSATPVGAIGAAMQGQSQIPATGGDRFDSDE